MADIYGVYHVGNWTEHVINELSNNHPLGIESLLLELPKNFDEISKICNPKFNLIATYFSDNFGTKIINGDIEIKVPSKLWYLLNEYKKNPDNLKIKFLLYKSFIGFNIVDFTVHGALDIFTQKRNKYMLEVVKKHNPQVIVLGNLHAKFLSKNIPNSRYIDLK
ncbi:MAG: hypothetical protein KC550_01465 [Nanoarchaeota archaeon]|nr:hypothetical protein [Nanoarchaeota archaeon]